MAFRGRTPTMSDDVDRSYDSSPDPLALSLNENNTRSARKSSPRKALISTSPSKQNRRSSVSEMDFSSPSKAMVLNTPRMGSASPWRIKVTVQAEPGSDEENDGSPSVKRVTRTQTTTVPLKDPDAPSSPVKRGRGRPRKSDIGAASKPKRSRDRSMGPAESSAADVDTDAPPKRKRGQLDTKMVEDQQIESRPFMEVTPEPAAKSDPSTSQKSIRFASPQASVPAIETTDATPQAPASMLLEDKKQNGTRLMLPADRRRRKLMAEYELPVLDTPPRTDLGDRLRARKGTPHSKKAISVLISSDEGSDQDSDVLTPTSGEDDVEPGADDPDQPNTQPEDAETSDRPLSYSLKEVPIVQVSDVDDEEEMQDATNFMFDEGTTRMPDDTTVIDSENFSMISVDSLPSSGGLTSPAQPQELSIPAPPRSGSKLRHEYLVPAVPPTSTSSSHTEAKTSPDITQNSSSLNPAEEPSRPALRRYITPIINTAVPTAPPVIEPTQAAPPRTETPRLGRVVTAGVALQGVLDPTRLTPEPSQKMLDEKRDRLDDLFRGFSDGTRRELQAGLRLGEQLAQSPTKEESPLARGSRAGSSEESAPKEGVFRTQRKARQPRLLTPEDQEDDAVVTATESANDDVQYPALRVTTTEKSLPSPAVSEDGDEMSWRVDTPPVATGNTERMRSVTIIDKSNEAQPHMTSSVSATTNAAPPEDYSDIWQEEASRSSNSAESEEAPKLQDLLEPGPAVPARGKLPRTWRRTSGNRFQYSYEAESPQQSTNAPVEYARNVPEVVVEDEDEQVEHEEDEDAASDASDDTGMFFQSNMPSIFSKRHSRDLKKRKADKLDLTLLLNEDSSIRRVRNEANEYLDAYEPQERSLDEVEEVTEPSRTWHKTTIVIEPNLPQIKMLSPVRKRVPLFPSAAEKPRFALHQEVEPQVSHEEEKPQSETSSSSAEERILTPLATQQRPTGLLTRMTSSLWSAVTRPTPLVSVITPSTPPAPHPILAKLTPLPKIEPWTKTHYKTFDKLYQVNQKHPALFSPSITPATPLSQTNAHLLDKFLSANKETYVGAVFSAWGYEFDMSEELVVLCQVFCELMTLESIEAYEVLKGRQIEMGDCLPGRTGDLIQGEEVVRRLATVVLGEEVRADERRGLEIDRSKGLEVQWPQ
ncbi:hypothetical protein EK21DRAFT_95874 [Setomelanomma holmii]|uniref:Uncharacterized protein n=1 Tax=Setomelanomma holmii TaxID=210430 RepID=A0A9P4HLW8_9PLEO|nr:hypothetical protein EK21DRAFT_95874 [Setomelanomma holmii]